MGSCYNKIDVGAPINRVWNAISNFHDMSWAPGVIMSVEVVGDKKGNELGAKRCLNQAFHETLTHLDADNYTFSYSIDDGPGPVAKDAVNRYIGVVKLTASDSATLVEWSSSFESEQDDDVAAFCNAIYQALLAALKKTLS